MGLGVRHNARAGPAFYIIQGIPLISNMREGGSSKQPQKIEHPIKPMTMEVSRSVGSRLGAQSEVVLMTLPLS